MADNAPIRPLDEPPAGRLTIQYAPDAAEIMENPPRFTWIPAIDDEVAYALSVVASDGSERLYPDIPVNFFTPPDIFPAGDYTWKYCVWNKGRPVSTWSRIRSFTIAEGLPETPLAPRETRYGAVAQAHPRLWLNAAGVAAFRSALEGNPDHCGWSAFMDRSVVPWAQRPPMSEPAPYPNDTRVAHIWRQTYIDCQELLYAIRHQAIAGKILQDAALIRNAKAWLLEAARWDPDGTTSRSYTDEWAFRVNLALAWGYDWLYDDLTDDERLTVRTALLARTRQVADHCIQNARIHLFPFDSHAIRSISAVLVPACLAMLGEEPEAEEWLNYAVEFFFTVYSPWGDRDGGWAEGPHYWMTGMAYLIDAANLLRSAAGIDLYRRPFFQRTGDFPLYTKAPDTRRATFGDDSTMGDLPCLKVGYNLRQFAGVTGNPAYQWYFEEIRRNDPGTEKAFYNWGWWDLTFDDLMFAHDFDGIEAVPPGPADRLRWFRGIGWVAIQSRMDDPGRHIQFVMKSSPWGSISHSHGDQNAFCLAAFGEDLAIQSGHYVAFNSSMHRNWRRQTVSKNAILLNGKGQYAGRDKAAAMKAAGRILEAREAEDHIFIRGDATAAYQSLTPDVSQVLRDVYFVHDSYFVIVDRVDATAPLTLDWLMHANAPMDLGATTFRYFGTRAGLYGKFLWSEAGPPEITQTTGFPGVDPAEIEGLDESTHVRAAFPAARSHQIATLLVPYPANAPRRVFHFLDDQGYDCDLYFTDADDRTFKIGIPKSLRNR
ncbi:MAG: DUF4962 domain-containing protein [Pseudomonadota bacterium]